MLLHSYLQYTFSGHQILACVHPLKGLRKHELLGLTPGGSDLTGLGSDPGDADTLGLGTTLRSTGLEERLRL